MTTRVRVWIDGVGDPPAPVTETAEDIVSDESEADSGA